MLLLYIAIVLEAAPAVLCVLGLESTFYEVTNVRQFNNYGSIELFEHRVPEMTSEVNWRFETGMSDDRCPMRNISVLLQHGSYPLPEATNNKTYPDDFYLSRTSFHRLDLNSTGNLTTADILLPTAGRWFGAAFVDYKEKNSVIKAINDLHCSYFIRVDVTAVFLVNSQQIISGSPVPVVITQFETYQLYRFFLDENIWGYEVQLTACTSSLASCPLELLSRGSGLPDIVPDQGTPVHSERCQDNVTDTEPCVLNVVSPLVGRWHYVKVTRDMDHPDAEINVTLTLKVKGCQVSADIYTRPTQSKTLNNASDQTDQSTAMPPIDSTTSLPVPYHHGYDSVQSLDPNSCGVINTLHRIEDMNNAIYAVYSLGPGSPEEMLTVSPYQVELVQFDVLPIKDSGGTLLFTALLTKFEISPNHTQNVTVDICLSPSRIPTNGSQFYCPPDGAISLSIDSGEPDWTLRTEIPYPEPGPYFVGFQSRCYSEEGSPDNVTKIVEPCVRNSTEVIFELTNGPCVNSSCDGHGQCNTYRKGAYIYSACSCTASYRGYTCEDDSETEPKNIQLLYTLLLTLSNLFFVPACVVCVYRRYYVEAIVYFSNMFFSGFYHACDMSPWSIYVLCIAPYRVLQYCDFLLSILSFWVTLIAMCEFPLTIVSVCHMAGLIGLAMGVEWGLHSTYIYVAVIGVGVAMVITMWIVRCARRHQIYPAKRSWLYMLPGFILAVAGLIVFGFIQDDVNYPYTHSTWHMCIALSIVFLVPIRKMRACLSSKDTNSDQSSNEYEFDQRDGNQFEPVPDLQFYTDNDQDRLVYNADEILHTMPPNFGLDDPDL